MVMFSNPHADNIDIVEGEEQIITVEKVRASAFRPRVSSLQSAPVALTFAPPFARPSEPTNPFYPVGCPPHTGG